MSTSAVPKHFLLLSATLFALAWLVPFWVLVRDGQFVELRAPGLVGTWRAAFVVLRAGPDSTPGVFETGATLTIDRNRLNDPIVGDLTQDLVRWVFDRGVTLMSTSYFPDTTLRHPTQHIRGSVEGHDSLQLAINPFMSHGVVVLLGSQHADTLAGRWFMVTDWMPVNGTFRWVRVHTK
jgi:hypothetical protein